MVSQARNLGVMLESFLLQSPTFQSIISLCLFKPQQVLLSFILHMQQKWSLNVKSHFSDWNPLVVSRFPWESTWHFTTGYGVLQDLPSCLLIFITLLFLIPHPSSLESSLLPQGFPHMLFVPWASNTAASYSLSSLKHLKGSYLLSSFCSPHFLRKSLPEFLPQSR